MPLRRYALAGCSPRPDITDQNIHIRNRILYFMSGTSKPAKTVALYILLYTWNVCYFIAVYTRVRVLFSLTSHRRTDNVEFLFDFTQIRTSGAPHTHHYAILYTRYPRKHQALSVVFRASSFEFRASNVEHQAFTSSTCSTCCTC